MTIEELVEWVEKMFDCKDGPHQAFLMHGEERLYYQTVGLICPDAIPEAREKLRDAMKVALARVRTELLKTLFGDDLGLEMGDDRRVFIPLYWRYAKECRILEETLEASPHNTPFQYREPKLHKIMTRIAIPGADWSVIEIKKEGEEYPRLKDGQLP